MQTPNQQDKWIVNQQQQQQLELNKRQATIIQSIEENGRIANLMNRQPMAKSKLSNYPKSNSGNIVMEQIINDKSRIQNLLRTKDNDNIVNNSGRHFKLAILYLFGGLVMFTGFDPAIDFAIDYQTQVKPYRMLSWIWKRNPIPIFGDFYLFGVSNAEAFLNGAKPIMREYGPFSFDLYRSRQIFEWGDTTVKFMETYDLQESEDRPTVSMDTKLKIVNFPVLVVVGTVRKVLKMFYVGFLSPIVSNLATMALRASGESLIEVRSARELLLGRQMPLVAMLESILQPLRNRGIPIPELRYGSFGMRNSTFGFIALIREAIFGPLETYSTTTNTHVSTHFVSFKESRTLANFKYPCNRIFGSGGMLFGRNINSPSIAVFNQLGCRTFILKNKRVEYLTGVRTIRYELDPDSFNMINSSYRCYCYDRSYEECDGWVNGASCYEGIDLAMSLPHFLYSPLRQHELRGLQPDPAKHASYINMEPNLGIPINAHLNMQGSIPVEAARWVPALSKLPKCLLPVFWMSIHRSANTYQAAALFVALKTLNYGSYGFLLGSLVLGGRQLRRGLQKRKLRTEIMNH